jgi:hypothetical protein
VIEVLDGDTPEIAQHHPRSQVNRGFALDSTPFGLRASGAAGSIRGCS